MSPISSKLLPENIRKCMPAEERKKTGSLTLLEVFEKEARGEELKIHAHFEDWCRLNGIPYVHSRTDRKSTIAPGHPDFTLLHSCRGCCIEFKAKNGKLSQEQAAKIEALKQARVPCLVTSDLGLAIKFARKHLRL